MDPCLIDHLLNVIYKNEEKTKTKPKIKNKYHTNTFNNR